MKYESQNDPQAIELNSMINELGVKETFRKISGLESNVELENKIYGYYNNI